MIWVLRILMCPSEDIFYRTSESSFSTFFSLASAYSDCFATCSKSEIRVWNTQTSQELLRIDIPNMTCNALDFMRNGKSIVSGRFQWPLELLKRYRQLLVL